MKPKHITTLLFFLLSITAFTPAQMYDEQGNLTWEADLDIYGRVRTFAGRSLNECPFRFQGQYFDEETGLAYNRFRYYDPDSGNYISQDPIGLDGGIALYTYVHDTNNWIDEFGLAKQGIHPVAPDYETKGLHGTFDGVELSIRPGKNSEISYKKVFSTDGDISRATRNANEYFNKGDNIKKGSS
jgi:RHS repeat-associated protein